MSQARSAPHQDHAGPSVADRALTVFALLFMIVLVIADAPETDDRVAIVLTGIGWAPLLVRHRWPVAALAVVLAIECLHIALVPLAVPVQFTSIPVATMVATYTIATRYPWRSAWLYGGAAALILLCVGGMARDGERLAANMFALDLVLGATGAGVLVRSRHQRLAAMQRRAELAEQTKEDEARRRVASERLRMARELHDVVAHHLTLVNAQAGVAEYLVRTDPESAGVALQNLAEHTKQALDELRSTVGLLRQIDIDSGERRGALEQDDIDEPGPMPGLADLPLLIERHAAMPGAVTFTVEGADQPLPTLTGLSAYRIIQEALTNARKHAPGASVRVELRWSPDALAIRVSNDPPVHEPLSSAAVGTGHGVLGMAERALAANGSVTAGRQPDGGWLVDVRLPLDSDVEEIS